LEDAVGNLPGRARRRRIFDIGPVSNNPAFGNAVFGEQELETVLGFGDFGS